MTFPTQDDLARVIAFLESNGWSVVPNEPTDEMVHEGEYGAQAENASWTWRYMIAAAPKAVKIQGRKVEFSRASSSAETDQ